MLKITFAFYSSFIGKSILFVSIIREKLNDPLKKADTKKRFKKLFTDDIVHCSFFTAAKAA